MILALTAKFLLIVAIFGIALGTVQIQAQDTANTLLQQWSIEKDPARKLELANAVITRWPGSEAAETIFEGSIKEGKFSKDQLGDLASEYLQALAKTNQVANAKGLTSALKQFGVTQLSDLLPAPLGGIVDSGTFDLYSSGRKTGDIEFDWKRSGAYTSKATVSTPVNTTVVFTTTIEVDASGYWNKVISESPMGGPSTLERRGYLLTLDQNETKVSGAVLPKSILVEQIANPALFALAARAYDPAGPRLQTIWVQSPLSPRPSRSKLERKNLKSIDQLGEFTEFEMQGYPSATRFIVDSKGKVVLVRLFQGRTFVRRGFEQLMTDF